MNEPAAPPSTSVRSAKHERLETIRQELEWRRCSRSWRYWLFKYVITKDENDDVSPFKSFPELPYIFLIGQLYLNQKLLVILKSRQLMITWLCCALDLWQAMFKPGRFIPISAYKEEDAADIVDRIEFIIVGQPGHEDKAPGLPTWMRERSPHKRLRDPHQIEFPMQGSRILALAEGSDQGRGKTISRWRNEESRTQLRLQQSSQSILPTLKNGKGQAVYVSSAGPGYFQAIVEDRLDAGDPPAKRSYRCGLHGIQLWRNARNGFYIVRIHYTADPAKRDPRWAARTKSGLPQYAWDQEYEIDFGARSGQPALPIFGARQHLIVIPPFDVARTGWRVFGAADYGTTNPYCFLGFAIDSDNNLYVFYEYYAPGPLGLHLATIKSHPLFPQLELYALDASCWAETQQASPTIQGQTLHSMRSVADLHMDMGVYPNPAHIVDDTVKVNAIYREWGEQNCSPHVFIFSTCTNLIGELPGIRWAEKKNPLLNNSEKLVDADNHAFDALCYGILYHREGAPTLGKSVRILPGIVSRVDPDKWSKEEHERVLVAHGIAAVVEENLRQDERDEARLSGIEYGDQDGDDTWGLDG